MGNLIAKIRQWLGLERSRTRPSTVPTRRKPLCLYLRTEQARALRGHPLIAFSPEECAAGPPPPSSYSIGLADSPQRGQSVLLLSYTADFGLLPLLAT